MRISTIFFILTLTTALSGDTIQARQLFFRTVDKDPGIAETYLNDKNPEIRRYALYVVLKQNGAKLQKNIVENALKDPDEQVRLTIVSFLTSPQVPKTKWVLESLQHVAKQDKSRRIRQIAVQATWPFHREIKLLRNDPTWDYEVKTIQSIPLEKIPWYFTTDPLQEGHLKGYFKRDFNRSSWKPIKMGTWENQGFTDYDGVAWYMIKFKMPQKIDSNAVEISFGAVDESAWVWLNGVYLGSHDIGPEGWKEPFAVDCRKEIAWGKENILIIRVYDAAFAGGIYKPVRVDILK